MKENVSYTDDGILVLTGNGNYYDGPIRGVGQRTDGTKTGAALISKFFVGPGRYEIKMKPHPRLGTCSAMWTYAYDGSNPESNNHEIDIEMSGDFTYRHIYNTSWLSDAGAGTKEYYVTEIDPVNDGEWHVFGFDWHTDPQYIDYYIDGEFVQRATAIIPWLQSRLWIGVWFPQGWGGEANFETDNMLVDWVKYIPFKDQPFTEYESSVSMTASLSEYPTHPVAMPEDNKLANASFTTPVKGSVEDSVSNAWRSGLLASAGSDDVTELIRWGSGYGKDGGCGANVRDGAFLSQYVDAVYENYEYTLRFEAKAVGNGAKVQFMFYPDQDNVLTSESIAVAAGDWKEYTLTLRAPANTSRIRIRFDSAAGGELSIANAELKFIREISE